MSTVFESPFIKKLQERCFKLTSAMSVLLTILRYYYLLSWPGLLLGLVTGFSSAIIGIDINRIKMFPETLSSRPPPSWAKALFVLLMITLFSANSFVYTFVNYQLAFEALGLLSQGSLFISLGVSLASLSFAGSFLNLMLAYTRDWQLQIKGLFFEKIATALNFISQLDNHVFTLISFCLTLPGTLGLLLAIGSRVSAMLTSFVLDYATNILDKKIESKERNLSKDTTGLKRTMAFSLGALAILEVSLSALLVYVQGFLLLTTAILPLPYMALLIPALFFGTLSALSSCIFHARHLEKTVNHFFCKETTELDLMSNSKTLCTLNRKIQTPSLACKIGNKKSPSPNMKKSSVSALRDWLFWSSPICTSHNKKEKNLASPHLLKP